MLDLQLIESRGGTAKAFRALFEQGKGKKQDPLIKKLSERHSNILRRAIETNLTEAPIYGAIDHALEAAQSNLPNIQARMLASMGKTDEEIIKLFKDFKLDRMLEPAFEVKDGQMVPKLNQRNEPILTFNKPIFEEVFLPMVQCYADTRAAKLFNDRNDFPRYKYAPPRMTQQDMVISDIVTNRVQRMTSEMGYADDDKQSIKQMLYYGHCFNFPMEAYHIEKYDTEVDKKTVTKVQREGVRFVIPHPSRSFWDRSRPLYTFNSDTGVNHAGYWDIKRWAEIKDNPIYWNTDKITYGGYDLFSTATWRIFQSFYPCVIHLPNVIKDLKEKDQFDRIAKEQSSFMKDETEATITHAVIFDKVVPKDWNLFDYDKPVWMRFIYANFETCCHCEVMPYTPGYVYLDCYDANKTVASSVGLKLTPFAQLLGNFLTQHFMAVKQNMLRVNWVNTDIVPGEQLTWLRNLKDKIYQGVQWLTYSKKHNTFQIGDRGDQREAITSTANPQVNTQELATNISLVFSAVERLLGFSPQEVGAAASHEQSAKEVSVTSENTSVNLEFTGTGIDSAWASKKRLLYTAFYCFGTDEIFAEIADLTPERKAALEKLKFEVEEGSLSATHAGVKGKKGALVMDTFFTDREGVTRLNDSKVGIAMMQMLGQYAANPVLLQSIGTKKFVELSMYVWRMVGLPDDFRIDTSKIQEIGGEQQQQAAMKMVQQMKEAIVKEAVQIAEQQIGGVIKGQVIDPTTKEFLQVKDAIEKIVTSVAQVKQGDEQQTAAIQTQGEAIQRLMPLLEVMQQLAPPQPPMIAGVPPQIPNANVPVRPDSIAPVAG